MRLTLQLILSVLLTTQQLSLKLTMALRYVSFGGYIGSSSEKYNLVGWVDNTTIQGNEGDNFDVEFKLEYSNTDGLIRLYRNDALVLTSASAYVGAQTLTFAAFDDQAQTDVYIPPT